MQSDYIELPQVIDSEVERVSSNQVSRRISEFLKPEFAVYARNLAEWDKSSPGVYSTYRWNVGKLVPDSWIPVEQLHDCVEDDQMQRPRAFIINALKGLGYQVQPGSKLQTYTYYTLYPDHNYISENETPTAAMLNCVAHGIKLGVVPEEVEEVTIRDWVDPKCGTRPKNKEQIQQSIDQLPNCSLTEDTWDYWLLARPHILKQIDFTNQIFIIQQHRLERIPTLLLFQRIAQYAPVVFLQVY